MSKAIKCPQCQTWNENEEICLNCGEIIGYELKKAKEREVRANMAAKDPPNALKVLMERLKASNRKRERLLYYLLQSVWALLIVFTLAILSIVVFGPG